MSSLVSSEFDRDASDDQRALSVTSGSTMALKKSALGFPAGANPGFNTRYKNTPDLSLSLTSPEATNTGPGFNRGPGRRPGV